MALGGLRLALATWPHNTMWHHAGLPRPRAPAPESGPPEMGPGSLANPSLVGEPGSGGSA